MTSDCDSILKKKFPSPSRELSFDIDQEVPEPLKGVHGGAEPIEVDLLKAERLVSSLLTVEDGLEDGGEGSDSNTSTDQETNLVREDILTGSTKWTVHSNPEVGRDRIITTVCLN